MGGTKLLLVPKDDRRLGRGLLALLGEHPDGSANVGEMSVPTEAIRPNPFQPRGNFTQESLAELANSIQENGLLHPILVRNVGSAFEIIAGERRFRAIQKLGWNATPVLVRDLADNEMLVMALVENLQREDLSAMEEARGYKLLIEKLGFTQKDVARRVGRNRSTIANSLRLLSLPDQVIALLEDGSLSAGHGRAILMLPDQDGRTKIAMEAVKRGWSVRETERRVRAKLHAKPKVEPKPHDPVVKRARVGLERSLGTKVKIRAKSGGAGEVVVPFYNFDDFLRLVTAMGGKELSEDLRE